MKGLQQNPFIYRYSEGGNIIKIKFKIMLLICSNTADWDRFDR